jgi:hypothetical protein
VTESETRGQTKQTDSVMGIDGCKKRSTNAVMRVLLVRDMGAVPVTKFPCKAKVDDVDEVRALTGAHNEVGGLDVAMDEVV